MLKPEPVYSFDENGMPTLAKKWDGNLPEIPTFPETESGRRRKGELEVMVDYVVKWWTVIYEDGYEEIPDQCTAEYIAQQCTALDGRPTSSGAVWKILTNWRDWDYAEIAEKPNRFIFFTENGMKLGLEEIHRRIKRAEKRERGARLRGEGAYRAIPKAKLRAKRR